MGSPSHSPTMVTLHIPHSTLRLHTPHSTLRILVTLCVLTLAVTGERCDQALRDFEQCAESARQSFTQRPASELNQAKDFCDLVSIFYSCTLRLSQACPLALDSPDTEAQFTQYIDGGLDIVSRHNQAWDESKCPAASAFRNREWNKMDCGKKDEMLQECYNRATQDYHEAVKPKTDGRPNFMERKACNLFTAMFQDCSDAMIRTSCYTSEDMNSILDNHLPRELARWTGFLTSWDSDRCPIVSDTQSRWITQGFTPVYTHSRLVSSAGPLALSVFCLFVSLTLVTGGIRVLDL